jgi:hypothetical protein
MAVIVVCIGLVLAGLVAVGRWGRLTVELPQVSGPEGAGWATRRRWGWWCGATCGP